MKYFLATVISSLLSLVMVSIAAAQEIQLPREQAEAALEDRPQPPDEPARVPPADLAQTAPAPPSQSPPLPVADAKKRYLATQDRLQNLVKGGNLPSARWKKDASGEARLEIEANEQPRDRLRTAVADEFDARRQLQQSELAELEGRIARIKRALSIRDAMRDTIIDQRTDELLDQLEGGGKNGQSDQSATPGGAPGTDRPAAPGPNDAAATPPVESDADTDQREARLLELDVDEAKAILEAAEKAYKRAQAHHVTGVVTQEMLDEKAEKYKRAKIQLDRAVLKMDAFRDAHRPALPATKEPADDGADATQREARLLKLEIAKAKAILDSAERGFQRAQRLHASGVVSQEGLNDATLKRYLARMQLDRLVMKRDEFLEAHPSDLSAIEDPRDGDGAVDERITKSSEQPPLDDRQIEGTQQAVSQGLIWLAHQAPLDESQIIWDSEDTDLLPAGEPIGSIQIGHIVEPEKSAYAPGDVLTAKLFLKYTGKQTRKLVVPPSESLERLGIELVLREAAGAMLNWQWGPAHKEPVRSGNVTMAFEPGAIKQFPDMKLVVGRAEMPGSTNDEAAVFAYLDAKPGQTAPLQFKLTSDLLRLESEPFEFHVEEPPKELPTGDGPVTDKAPN